MKCLRLKEPQKKQPTPAANFTNGFQTSSENAGNAAEDKKMRLRKEAARDNTLKLKIKT